MTQPKFDLKQLVFVDESPAWVGHIIGMRCQIEDELYVYIIRDTNDPDHVETVKEGRLTIVEDADSTSVEVKENQLSMDI